MAGPRPIGSVKLGDCVLRFTTGVQVEIDEETGDLGFIGLLDRVREVPRMKDVAYLVQKAGGLDRDASHELIDAQGFPATVLAVMQAAVAGLGMDVAVNVEESEAPALGNAKKPSRTAKS